MVLFPLLGGNPGARFWVRWVKLLHGGEVASACPGSSTLGSGQANTLVYSILMGLIIIAHMVTKICFPFKVLTAWLERWWDFSDPHSGNCFLLPKRQSIEDQLLILPWPVTSSVITNHNCGREPRAVHVAAAFSLQACAECQEGNLILQFYGRHKECFVNILKLKKKKPKKQNTKLS